MNEALQTSASTVPRIGDVGKPSGQEGGSGVTQGKSMLRIEIDLINNVFLAEPSTGEGGGRVNQNVGPVDPKDVQEQIPEEVLSPEIRSKFEHQMFILRS